MWGINPVVVAQILGTVVSKDIFSRRHGVPKMIINKITIHIAQKEIELAKAMARSVARQDKDLYEELKRDLRTTISEVDFQQIFSD